MQERRDEVAIARRVDAVERRRGRSRAARRARPCRWRSWCRRWRRSRAAARRPRRGRDEPRDDRAEAPRRARGRSARPAPAARAAGACTTASARRPPRSACCASAPTSARRSRCRTADRGASEYSRRSSDTCSFRDRPVCSRRPASPMRATSSRSTKECTSSSSSRMSRRSEEGSIPPALGEDVRSEPPLDRGGVRGGQHAGARERLGPRQAAPTSSSNSRRSKRNDAPKSNTSGVGLAGEPAGPESRRHLSGRPDRPRPASRPSPFSPARCRRASPCLAPCAPRSRPAGPRS